MVVSFARVGSVSFVIGPASAPPCGDCREPSGVARRRVRSLEELPAVWTGSRKPVEPVGREAGAGDDEEQPRGRETLRYLTLFVRVADLAAQALVDLGQVRCRRRLEVPSAGRL